MTSFINLTVTNGGNSAGEGGFAADPSMDGDNLINTDHISFVKPVINAGLSSNKFEILVNFLDSGAAGGDIAKYTVEVSKARSGSPDGAANKPSTKWMTATKKVITEAMSNAGPGGKSNPVVLPRDGQDQVYFRSIQFN
jgi:hypothetical protein